MKSLSVKLGVILIGLVIFTYVEVWGEDWKYIGETQGGVHYYDPTSITCPSKNIVRIWTKFVYSEKAVIDTVRESGSRFKNLKYNLILFEFNCSNKMIRSLSIAFYSKDGLIIEDIFKTSEWDYIPPESAMETLRKAVCK